MAENATTYTDARYSMVTNVGRDHTSITQRVVQAPNPLAAASNSLATAVVTEVTMIKGVKQKYGAWHKQLTDWKYVPVKTCYISKEAVMTAVAQYNHSAKGEGLACWGNLLAQFQIIPQIMPLSECNLAIDGVPAVRCDVAALSWLAYSSQDCKKWVSDDGSDIVLTAKGIEVLLHTRGGIAGGFRTLGHVRLGAEWRYTPWHTVDIPSEPRSYVELIQWFQAKGEANDLDEIIGIFEHANKIVRTGYAQNTLFDWDVKVEALLGQVTDIVDTIKTARDRNEREDQFCTIFTDAGLFNLQPITHRAESVQFWKQAGRDYRQGFSTMDPRVDVTYRDKTIKCLVAIVFVVLSYEPVPSRWSGSPSCALAASDPGRG